MAGVHAYSPVVSHGIYSLELRIIHLELDFNNNGTSTLMLHLCFDRGSSQ